MTNSTAAEILHQLQRAKPRPTSEAPRDCRGIYGLIDHLGDFRYIGSTSAKNETFYKRIHQRHRTGSETTSHYFSRMYNTGRMWRMRNDPATKADGDIAKSLRNAFIARHCRAVWVPLSDHADIAGLEAEVISLAPPEMIAWNRRGMEVYDEPTSLVDALITSLSLSPFERAALGRQSDRSSGTKTAAITAGAVPALPRGPFRFFALDVETANNGHGLASLKAHLGLRFEHHDAGEDARAAAELVLLAEKGAASMVKDFEVLDEDDNVLIETAPAAPARSATSRGTVGSSILTQGNLNNHHFYLREFISAFPKEVIGGGNRASAASRTISVSWGEETPINTDIDGTKKIFRDRAWVRTFFERNAARPGDTVEVIESAPYCYQVALVRA